MLTLERKKIGKEFHPFRKNVFSLAGASGSYAAFDEAKDKKVLKYAPRCLESLQIQRWKEKELVDALKRVKKISAIVDDPENPVPKQWRLVLQNKFKIIQSYRRGNERTEALAKYKAFSRVAAVTPFESAALTWKICRYVPGLANLTILSISIDHQTHPNLLKKINSMTKILSSIKYVFIDLDLSYDTSLSSFAENENILRCLTHLVIRGEAGENFSETFELLSSREWKRLIWIVLNYSEIGGDQRGLRSLKNFESLRTVKIISQDLLSFFENFTLPPSVKEIHLELGDLSDALISILGTQSPEEILEKDPKFASFIEKWRVLQNLVSLKISVQCHPEAISLILALINLILQRTPTLVNFDLRFESSLPDNHQVVLDPIDLRNLFGTLQKFSDKLQTICLQFPRSDLLKWWSLKKGITFPQLTQFKLTSRSLSSLEAVRNLFSALKRLVSDSHVEISLGKYLTNSNQDLLNLLQVLRKPPRNSKVKFEIEVQNLDFDNFDGVFEEFIEKAKRTPVVQNVSLNIYITPKTMRVAEALKFSKEVFGNVQIC